MLARLKAIRRTLRREITAYQLLLKDPRTPIAAKIVLGLAVGYLVLPFDLIPDWIPVIGQLDDVIIVPALVWFALRMVPEELIDDARSRSSSTWGE